MRVFLIILTPIIIVCALWFWYGQRTTDAPLASYRTALVTKGEIRQEIHATGIVAPIKEVEVGTQVNGRIIKLYVDFNSLVTNNQIVAQIDPDVYEANYARDTAQLKSNQANVEQIHAKLSLATKDLARKHELARRQMLSAADLDAAQAEHDALKAQLKVAEASVEHSQAAVKLSKTNLDYCTIRSPVNGVVIARNVDEGQTVVSAMNAQQLYLIATDLKRIQVEASIPEADVGQIKTGQTVNFNVDAYRDSFKGVVKQIRLAATTTQNVVTYPVIVEADNPDEKLFPGMTANIAIEVGYQADALIVPTAALRLNLTNLVSDIRGAKIWLQKEVDQVEAIAVKPGLSNGAQTALLEPADLQGQSVIIGLNHTAQSSEKPKNPFMPRPPGGVSPRNIGRAMR